MSMKTINKFKIYSNDLEDFILYYVFAEEESIFYVDIGASDPDHGSATKSFYENGIGHGVNIEPQRKLYEKLCEKRTLDKNVLAVVGNENKDHVKFYLYSDDNSSMRESESEDYDLVPMMTYQKIMESCAVNNSISVLKIDVEGFELEVLEGGLGQYRPKVILCEYVPGADTRGYEDYEKLLSENGYDYCMSYLSNRYYVERTESRLRSRFVDVGIMLDEVPHEFDEERVQKKIAAERKISNGEIADPRWKEYKKIVIYGMGPLGILLYEQMRSAGFTNVLAVDQNAATFDPRIPFNVHTPESVLGEHNEEVELVILTFQTENRNFVGGGIDLTGYRVISIFERV